jgi:hypothetical protein
VQSGALRCEVAISSSYGAKRHKKMMSSSFDDDGDEAVISFGDEDDDDDMADLFSFGAVVSEAASKKQSKNLIDYSQAMASVMPLPASAKKNQKDDDDSTSDHSEDSFLDLLEQQTSHGGGGLGDVIFLSSTSTKRIPENTDTSITPSGRVRASSGVYDEDQETQDILNWLDEQDEEGKPMEEELVFVDTGETPPSLDDLSKTPPEPIPTPTLSPIEFDTLEQAVKSHKSSLRQIRILLEKEGFAVTAKVRPHLWCRVVTGKTLEGALKSSVGDSFQQWEQQHQNQQPKNKDGAEQHPQNQQLAWISKESAGLADRIVAVTHGDTHLCQKALESILLNHYSTGTTTASDEGEKGETQLQNSSSTTDTMMDTLIPPVACAILSAGVPKVAAALVLSQIVPSFMPFMALTIQERDNAAKLLHRQFYLLACYHLPLLVYHLDRYLPDWYTWPPSGFVPQSWLISQLAGECQGQGTFMNPKLLLSLWDVILTSNNNSLRFFLVMAILETHSDQLLLLTDSALKEELTKIMQFKENVSGDGFAIEAEDDTSSSQAVGWVLEWVDRARALWEATPVSVVRMLKKLEDDTVQSLLTKRQQEAEERLRLKLEAQAKAHQEAAEAERERKSDEARLRLTRARLIAFYRTYNPGKETNIDKIMTSYEGRYDVLDSKLKQKYGVGFNPAIKPKPVPKNTNKLSGFGAMGFFGGGGGNNNKRKEEENEFAVPAIDKREKVAVTVQASEVLPILCWSKQGNVERLGQLSPTNKGDQGDDKRLPLKFYLVDSRPEAAALDQGRFPTSVSLSPETLLDADQIQQHEDMFESLRGAVHICIMGEGFSALPRLYGHKMTQNLYEYMKEDESRNNLCALFFIKQGFPFVSVLDGGFAAAHAWLCREGPSRHLTVGNVLTDYSPDVSLFGQFESLYQEQQAFANATGREKTQRALQGLFESSMTALTRNTLRLESLASETETTKKGRQNVVTNLFGANKEFTSSETGLVNRGDLTTDTFLEQGGVASTTTTTTGENVAKPMKNLSAAFHNPFARTNLRSEATAKEGFVSELSRDVSQGLLEVESVDFENSPQEEIATGSECNDSEAATPHPSVRTAPPTNTFNSLRPQHGQTSNASDAVQADAKQEPAVAPPQQQKVNNPFGGFGAALNNTRKLNPMRLAGAGAPNNSTNVPRNPFSRFGLNSNARNNGSNSTNNNSNDSKGNVETNNSYSSGLGKASPFVGFGQLRMVSMAAMMRNTSGAGSNDEATIQEQQQTPHSNSGHDGSVSEESISFDQSSPAIATSSSGTGSETTAQGEEEPEIIEDTPSERVELSSRRPTIPSEENDSAPSQKTAHIAQV